MATKKGEHYVHGGDVQMLEAKIPANAKPVKSEPLAYGEKSGHIHIVTGDVQMFKDEKGETYIAVGGDGATLQHVHESSFKGDYSFRGSLPKADHKQIPLKPNTTYRTGIHKRYNPFAGVWEKAKD